MSRLPYPVNNMGPPYSDPNAKNRYGQPTQGVQHYPTSDTAGSIPYPLAPNPSNQLYQQQQNLPYGMPPNPSNTLPLAGPGSTLYPSYNQAQQGNSNVYPTQVPYPNPQQNTPYQSTAFAGPYGYQPPPPTVPSAPYPSAPTAGNYSMETVEHNRVPGKGLFSKSGFLGKALDKGIS